MRRQLTMLPALFDFFVGLLAGRAVANTAQTARNSAIAAERALWTEAQKVERIKRAE
jgi:hypothetical protein